MEPRIRERNHGFHNRMRFIGKHITNPLLHRFAGSARSPFALLQHVDVASGTLSEGFIIVEPIGSAFLLALPGGPDVRWYQEALAGGRCRLRWRGRIYELNKAKAVDAKTALRAFPPVLRLILRARATKHFRMMTAQIVQAEKNRADHVTCRYPRDAGD